MSNLHVYFHLKNEQAFAKALEAARSSSQTAALSSSAGRRNAQVLSLDINARDWLGRTVLHLACTVTEPYALAYVRLLLAQPGINVNMPDTESKWTPLHRALYAGNVPACQLLLRRSDIDVQLRDNEGLTPFDLYNLTVEGTWPSSSSVQSGSDPPLADDVDADLFTWGGNRNAALGHGDSKDRTFPDQVFINRPTRPGDPDKFIPIRFKAVHMAKLHTVVITNERGANLRACGFGSGGRLGPSQHTQYDLIHIPQIPSGIIAVAPAQDHTVALTSRGEVWTWGLGRFTQLGYIVEQASGASSLSRTEEPIQILPRKVVGPLKKENVIGVTASKAASACWTVEDVFTWGTNNGQLGYDSSAQPLQVLPRKVTGVQEVVQIALTDTAMVCLVKNHEIVCFRDDARFRVKFPSPDPADSPYYIAPNLNKPAVIKVTSCEGTIAAVTARGEVWTFSIPDRSPRSGMDGDKNQATVKPQRVWAARKSVDPAKDAALGADGDLIVCTNSGRVFVRSRTSITATIQKGSTSLTPSAVTKGKFHRVPLLYRVVRVCVNATGSFGALRSNYVPLPIKVEGNLLGEDFQDIRPWAIEKDTRDVALTSRPSPVDNAEEIGDEDIDVPSTGAYSAQPFVALLASDKASKKERGKGIFSTLDALPYGADMIVQAGMDIPAHRLILSARSAALRHIIDTGHGQLRQDNREVVVTFQGNYKAKVKTLPRLIISGVQPLAVLFFLHFLYTDAVPVLDTLPYTTASQVLQDVGVLASVVGLGDSLIIRASGAHVPAPTLARDLWALFNNVSLSKSVSFRPDVVLELEDKNVPCHSVVLRARCLFFRNFFDEKAWTVNRWAKDGTIIVDMKHLEWKAMAFVMEWMYKGEEDALSTRLDEINSIQELIDLIFDVMAVASELVLDRLLLLCSSCLLRYITLHNVISILSRATYYNALVLVSTLHDYVACNLEAVMEHRLLERDLDAEMLVPALGAFVRGRQADNTPVTRSGILVEEAMKKHRAWLELQDIPSPLLRTPLKPRELTRQTSLTGLPSSPAISSNNNSAAMDDIFSMDGPGGETPAKVAPLSSPGRVASGGLYMVPKAAWKTNSVQETPKMDMKAIMAEAATNSPPTTSKPSKAGVHTPGSTPPRATTSSPWRPLPQSSPSTSSTAISVQRPPPTSPPRVGGSPLTPGHTGSKAASAAPLSNTTLGPVITPTLGTRRTSSSEGPAWNVTRRVSESLPESGLSFAAIQQQQREQGQQPGKEKRSLIQIQEEERARQEEEDFLRWWAAEEQRLKDERESELKASLLTRGGPEAKHEKRNGQGGSGRRGSSRGGRGRGSRGDSSRMTITPSSAR